MKGDKIMLVVSGGRGEQTVPELSELNLDFARQRLKDLGLEMQVMEVVQSGFSTGDAVTVIRQEPVAGTKLPVGSRVTVFIPIAAPLVDRPNDPTSTTLHAPRLEGLTVAQARSLAAKEGVILELVEAPEDSSVITFQDPPPGDPLPDGSPSGLPVQISKNWHEGGAKSWLSVSTVCTVAPNSTAALTLRVAFAHWGGLPSVSHAQLSLIGWGGGHQVGAR